MVALSAQASYYIVGSDPFGDWNPANGVPMEYVGDGYYEYTTPPIYGTVWFVFGDGLCDDWDTFNTYHRIGPMTDIDQSVDEYLSWIPTQKSGPGFNGAYKFTGFDDEFVITFDEINYQFKVESLCVIPEDFYTVAGSEAALFGSEWDAYDLNNRMKKGRDGLHWWTKEDVSLQAGGFDFKICYFGNWDETYPRNDFYHVDIPADDTYNVAISFNPETEEIDCSLVQSHLSGDLNNDGEVNIADISLLIDAIFDNESSSSYDINHDGEINITDITAILDFIFKA